MFVGGHVKLWDKMGGKTEEIQYLDGRSSHQQQLEEDQKNMEINDFSCVCFYVSLIENAIFHLATRDSVGTFVERVLEKM